MKRVFASLLACLALAMPQARAELRGKVQMLVNPNAPRTEWQRVPLPGAYIVVFWGITVPAPVHAISSCLYSEIARSDENGEYVMEGPNFITAGLTDTRYLAFSPGLDPINFPAEGSQRSEKDITMATSTVAAEERLARISSIYTDPHCSDTKLNDPRSLLGAYHHSLLDEARTLHVKSPRERVYLQSIEAAAIRSSGPQRAQPIRVVPVPSSGAMENSPRPPTRP